MKNDVTEMSGIDTPLFAFTHCRDVVVAVSKAGGMGVLGAAAHGPRHPPDAVAGLENAVVVTQPSELVADDQPGHAGAKHDDARLPGPARVPQSR